MTDHSQDEHDKAAREIMSLVWGSNSSAWPPDLEAAVRAILPSSLEVGQGWQPIETVPQVIGSPVWLRGPGTYHGIPFVAIWAPSEYYLNEPWLHVITKWRIPTHALAEWMPCNLTHPASLAAIGRARKP